MRGTVTSEYFNGAEPSTNLGLVTKFGFSNDVLKNPFMPIIQYMRGIYDTVDINSKLHTSSVGMAILDQYENMYAASRGGEMSMYENVCTPTVYFEEFSNKKLPFASPSYILTKYMSGEQNPFYDFFDSRFNNIWHFQGKSNLSTIYGIRFSSSYDFNLLTQFATQVFYPTHKIVMTPKNIIVNPMVTNTDDLIKYPSYPKSQMFFYSNYTTLMRDISGKFAMEKSSNFVSCLKNQ